MNRVLLNRGSSAAVFYTPRMVPMRIATTTALSTTTTSRPPSLSVLQQRAYGDKSPAEKAKKEKQKKDKELKNKLEKEEKLKKTKEEGAAGAGQDKKKK